MNKIFKLSLTLFVIVAGTLLLMAGAGGVRYVGNFTGNGAGLTNIPQAGVVQLSNSLFYLTNAAVGGATGISTLNGYGTNTTLIGTPHIGAGNIITNLVGSGAMSGDGGGLTNISGLSAGTSNWIYSIGSSVNRHFYFSSVTNGIGAATNTSSMIDVPVGVAATNTVAGVIANSYFLSRLTTNTIARLDAGPIDLQTYIWITGGGGVQSVTAHPEIYLWFTNDTILEVARGADQVFTEGTGPAIFNISMHVDNGTNLLYGTKLLLRWRASAVANTPTWNFAIGGDYDSHISVNTPSSGGTWIGTFIGDGSGLTNIQAASVVGMTNFANITVTNGVRMTNVLTAGLTNFGTARVVGDLLANRIVQTDGAASNHIAGDMTLVGDMTIGGSNYVAGDMGIFGTLFVDGVSASGTIFTSDIFEGNGSGITNLTGDEIRSGTVADARIASTIARDSEVTTATQNSTNAGNIAFLPADNGFTGTSNHFNGTIGAAGFYGDGSGLTNITATSTNLFSFTNMIWVTDFGATTNDDNSDDTAAFQAALDALDPVGGGVVNVPRGYFFLTQITMNKGATLAGAGTADGKGSQINQLAAAGDVPMIIISNAPGATIRDMMLQKTDKTGQGVNIINESMHARLANLKIWGFKYGVYMSNTWTHMLDNVWCSVNGDGIYANKTVNSVNVRGGDYSDNTNGIHLDLTTSGSWMISGATIEGNTGKGIWVENLRGPVSVSDCYFELNGDFDIHATSDITDVPDSAKLSIEDNFLNNTPTNIFLSQIPNTIIEGSRVVNAGSTVFVSADAVCTNISLPNNIGDAALTIYAPTAGRIEFYNGENTINNLHSDSLAVSGTMSIGTLIVTNPPVLDLQSSTNLFEKNVVVQTNTWGNQVVDFSRGTLLHTNMAGDLTLTGISNFALSNFNWMTVELNPNGATRVLTVPADWYVNIGTTITNGFTNATVGAIPDGTWAQLQLSAIIGVRTAAVLNILQ